MKHLRITSVALGTALLAAVIQLAPSEARAEDEVRLRLSDHERREAQCDYAIKRYDLDIAPDFCEPAGPPRCPTAQREFGATLSDGHCSKHSTKITSEGTEIDV